MKVLALTDENCSQIRPVPVGMCFWRPYLCTAGLTCSGDLASVLSDETERAMRCRVRPDHSASQPFRDLCRINHCGLLPFGRAVGSSDMQSTFRLAEMWVAGQVRAGEKGTFGDGAPDAVHNRPQALAWAPLGRTHRRTQLGAWVPPKSSAAGTSGDRWLRTREWAG